MEAKQVTRRALAALVVVLAVAGCEGSVRIESRPHALVVQSDSILHSGRGTRGLFAFDCPTRIDSVRIQVSGDTVWVSPVRIVWLRDWTGNDSAVCVVGQRIDRTLTPLRSVEE